MANLGACLIVHGRAKAFQGSAVEIVPSSVADISDRVADMRAAVHRFLLGEMAKHLDPEAAVEADGSGADDLRSSASGSERTAPEGSKMVLGVNAAIGLHELDDVPLRVGDENRPDPEGQVAGVGQLAPLSCVDLALERLDPARRVMTTSSRLSASRQTCRA